MARLDLVAAPVAHELTREEAMAILEDHNRRETHFGEPEGAGTHALGYNPSCGDRYDVFLSLEEGRIEQVRFHGFGCVISRASASMMAEALDGNVREEALRRIDQLRAAVLGSRPITDLPFDTHALLGVRDHPSRVKCVLLPWQAAAAALKGKAGVSTE